MRDRTIPSVDEMELIAGRLCLDFVNTVNRIDGQCHDERFETVDDVLRWCARLGLIDRATAGRLARTASRLPDRGESALQTILELRECLWRLFAGRSAARDPGVLRRALRGKNPRVSPREPQDGGVVLEPQDEGDLSDWLRLAVGWSAIELLTSASLARVKVCPGDRCNWLFLDDSPNSRRKWCSMKTCGNRHKAREHYNRLQAPAN